MPASRPRVILADDHALVAECLGQLLEPAFEVVAVASSGAALLDQAERLQPDVAILDVSMPHMDGFETARRLRLLLPRCRLIFLSAYSDPSLVAQAAAVGADAYLLKTRAVSEVQEAVARVLRSAPPAAPRRSAGAPDAAAPSLTARQRELLALVAQGKSLKEIAAALHISVKTVEFHKARIMARLGLRTTAELTRFALTHGIVREG